jgi:hypothetical protein
MNVLDHRILIDNRSPSVVWEQISDISKNPAWQVDCTAISFLSQRKSGTGMRWRYTSKSNREYIVETTAWYDGLGYEYTIIDGGPYRECRGRIRLQEIAEGTIVRWTFSYEMKGVIGGMRNALNHRRALEKGMIDSLKTLWRYMNQVDTGSPEFEARSLMRDAPDYETRSRYRPRHPSTVQEHTAEKPVEAASPMLLNEPPVQEEDTKPHAIPTPPVPVDAPVTSAQSDLAIDRVEPMEQSVSAQDQQEVQAVSAPPEPAEPPQPAPASLSDAATSMIEPPPATPPTPAQVSEPDAPKLTPRLTSITDTLPGTTVSAAQPQSPGERTTEYDLPPVDTREISVFELFGLTKPSETQEMQPVRLSTQTADIPGEPALIDPHAPTVVEHPLRLGLRLLLRRRRTKVRLPS